MTREYLLRLIYMSDYCHDDDYKCQSTTTEQCQECCNKGLTEYEDNIYNNALNDLLLMAIRKCDKNISFEELLNIINTLQKGIK